jgi:hypothetical protein
VTTMPPWDLPRSTRRRRSTTDQPNLTSNLDFPSKALLFPDSSAESSPLCRHGRSLSRKRRLSRPWHDVREHEHNDLHISRHNYSDAT